MNADPGGEVTRKVIGAAIEVHRELGPGLLESTYSVCLASELRQRGIPFAREVKLPVVYKGTELDCAYVMDLVVADQLVVELKAVEQIIPVHEAQVLTYLRLSGYQLGLRINFHSVLLKQGLRRYALSSAHPAPMR
jgi:GxxExxY protein